MQYRVYKTGKLSPLLEPPQPLIPLSKFALEEGSSSRKQGPQLALRAAGGGVLLGSWVWLWKEVCPLVFVVVVQIKNNSPQINYVYSFSKRHCRHNCTSISLIKAPFHRLTHIHGCTMILITQWSVMPFLPTTNIKTVKYKAGQSKLEIDFFPLETVSSISATIDWATMLLSQSCYCC